jgi:hypothetical protein
MNHRWLIAWMLVFIVSVSWSQVPADREALLSGDEGGQAGYAEESGCPSPRKVLDAAVELDLSASQKKEIRKIYDDSRERAIELGKQIVRIEQEISKAFHEGMVTTKSITADAQDIGRLRGKLRAVHFVAHLETKNALTSEQIRMYMKMRTGQSKR